VVDQDYLLLKRQLINLAHVLKSILWIILEIFIFLVIAILVGSIVGLIGLKILRPVAVISDGSLNPYTDIAVLAAIYFVKVIAFKIPELELGFTRQGIISDNVRGWALGFILVGIGALAMWLFGQVQIQGFDTRFYLFFGFIIFFIVQSFAEEVVFRSFLIPMIRQHLGTLSALIISSLLFAFVHLMNPNVSWPGVVNLILGGLFMGLLFLKYKNVWAPTGFHASWNFVQSAFLGFPVSGHETYSLVDLQETGNDYITGGAFGYEGSLVSIAIIIIATVYILKTDKALYQSLFEPVHHTT